MKKLTFVLALVLAVAMTLPAVAEVEEITAGGSIVIRGQYLGPGPADEVGEGNGYDSLWADDNNEALDWARKR